VKPLIGRETVTVVTRSWGPPDTLGVAAKVETPHTVTGCAVVPLTTQEDVSDVDHVVTRWRLFGPPDMAVTVTDAVIVGDLTYEVDGDPQVWPDARGVPHHLECYLRRATG